MDTFQYTPLDRSRECIRLLHFVDDPPSLEFDQFSLEPYDIATAPPFVALSYTWGSPEPCHDIPVNGSLLSIRENLWAALKALRHFFPNNVRSLDKQQRWADKGTASFEDLLQENGYPLMWIDAICINQSDHLEKNHQDLVISWLGDEANDSNWVMKAIRAATHTRKYSFKLVQAVEALVKRPYWRRMWVIQEFVLPQDLVILCGHEGARWEDLLHFWNDVKLVCYSDGAYRVSKGESVSSVGGGGLGALISARSSRCGGFFHGFKTGSGTISVDEIMTWFAYGQCSDPRDRIYALLALIKPEAGVEPLSADYGISAKDLYYRVLGYLGPLDNDTEWGIFRKQLREALDSSSWAGAETAELHEKVYEIVGMEHSHGWISKTNLAKEAEGVFTRVQECLADHLGQPVNGTLCEGDWTYYDIIRRFEAFPRGEDPTTWRRFDNLLLRWLHILPASVDSLFRDDLSDC